MQFDLSRNIDAAARDVQAAINAARGQLPPNLPNNPTYRKVNPADAPVLHARDDVGRRTTKPRMYDARVVDPAAEDRADSRRRTGGRRRRRAAGRARRRESDRPEQLRARPGRCPQTARRGQCQPSRRASFPTTGTNLDAWRRAISCSRRKTISPIVLTYVNGAALHLSDVANVTGFGRRRAQRRARERQAGGPADHLTASRAPTSSPRSIASRRCCRQLQRVAAADDRRCRSRWIARRRSAPRCATWSSRWRFPSRWSSWWCSCSCAASRSTLIPSVAVPVSLVGTFGVMYLFGYSLDNLSLMALTIATGFVVDDAIVVIENITRHLEDGHGAARGGAGRRQGDRLHGLSISVSLVAVFIPILLMGGIVGRLFREFAVTLSVAIFVSMLISLTTTPMMCAVPARAARRPSGMGWIYRANERVFDWILARYEGSLGWVLRHQAVTLLVAADHHGRDDLSLRAHSQGLLSAAGCRPADRHHPGRSGHLVPGDVAPRRAVRRGREAGSGGRYGGRLRGRRGRLA